MTTEPDPNSRPVPDSPFSDSAVSDSAMASGSDAGEPGEHLGVGDLSPDEERLLTELERDTDEPEEETPADGASAALRAAEDEAPLPAPGGAQDDGLTPRFSSPE